MSDFVRIDYPYAVLTNSYALARPKNGKIQITEGETRLDEYVLRFRIQMIAAGHGAEGEDGEPEKQALAALMAAKER